MPGGTPATRSARSSRTDTPASPATVSSSATSLRGNVASMTARMRSYAASGTPSPGTFAASIRATAASIVTRPAFTRSASVVMAPGQSCSNAAARSRTSAGTGPAIRARSARSRAASARGRAPTDDEVAVAAEWRRVRRDDDGAPGHEPGDGALLVDAEVEPVEHEQGMASTERRGRRRGVDPPLVGRRVPQRIEQPLGDLVDGEDHAGERARDLDDPVVDGARRRPVQRRVDEGRLACAQLTRDDDRNPGGDGPLERRERLIPPVQA